MNHKKVVIVAVALVALLAIAGIGAAYAYTATTKNTDNSIDTKYIALKQDDVGKYMFTGGVTQTVFWNSDDGMTGSLADPTYYTDYTLTGTPEDITVDEAYKVVQIGNSFKLKALPQTGDAVDPVDCAMTSVNVVKPVIANTDDKVYLIIEVADENNTDVDYFRVSGANAYEKYDTSGPSPAWTAGSSFQFNVKDANSYYYKEISVYFGYTAAQGKVTISNSTNADRPMNLTEPLDNSTFTFTLEKTGSNVKVTALTPSTDSVTLSLASTPTEDVTITVAPENAAVKNISVASGNTAVATVAVSGSEITITAVGTGTTVINVVSASDPSITTQINVTVNE